MVMHTLCTGFVWTTRRA